MLCVKHPMALQSSLVVQCVFLEPAREHRKHDHLFVFLLPFLNLMHGDILRLGYLLVVHATTLCSNDSFGLCLIQFLYYFDFVDLMMPCLKAS